MSNSLSHNVALVSGSSRGLGAAIAKKLAAHGAKVAINYHRNEGRAQQVKNDITAKGGVAEVFQADVRDKQQVSSLCQQIQTKFGAVDILVLNATSNHYHYSIEDMKWEHMLEMMDYFVKSPLLLTQELVKGMKQMGRGRIIHIGSEVFEQGIPNFSNYVAAKGAQLGLTRSWANELAPHNITVNLVAPGWIPTDMHASEPEENKQAYREKVPLQRMGEADDVAAMVSFLASDDAKFITGQKISVNGGNTLS